MSQCVSECVHASLVTELYLQGGVGLGASRRGGVDGEGDGGVGPDVRIRSRHTQHARAHSRVLRHRPGVRRRREDGRVVVDVGDGDGDVDVGVALRAALVVDAAPDDVGVQGLAVQCGHRRVQLSRGGVQREVRVVAGPVLLHGVHQVGVQTRVCVRGHQRPHQHPDHRVLGHGHGVGRAGEDGVVVVDVGDGERGGDGGGAGGGRSVVGHQDDQRVGGGDLAVQGLRHLHHAVAGDDAEVVVGVAAGDAVRQPAQGRENVA